MTEGEHSHDGDGELVERKHRDIAYMLDRSGHRYTTQRRRVIDALIEAGRPVTLPTLLDLDDSLSQSSAYRNLDILEQAGAIRRIVTGSEHAYYELAESLLGHHHHLICVDCGLVRDIELDDAVERAVDAALGRAASAAGFVALDHCVDLRGRCAECVESTAGA